MASDYQYYRAARVLVGSQWVNNGVVKVDQRGFIASIQPYCADSERLIHDLGQCWLMPGLIDSHVHGAKNCDVMDACHNSLNTMSLFFASQGVTAFVPTTVTAPVRRLRAALQQVAKSKHQGVDGAEILGAYLEGPYFTEKHRGAHPTEWFRELSVDELADWISCSDNQLITVALAPEKPGALQAIRYLKQHGITVMLGHSDATYDQVQQAFAAGADGIVHCYNGMRGLHHRDPGMVGAGLTYPNRYIEMIADGHHVHPSAIKIAYCCCPTHLTLITDAMCATGMADGQYKLGESLVNMNAGIVTTEAGGLAGSTLTLSQAVKNSQRWLGLSLEQAWLMASQTPAQLLGIQHQLGTLEVGKRASMVAIHSDLSIEKTWVNGRLVFDATTVPSQEALCI